MEKNRLALKRLQALPSNAETQEKVDDIQADMNRLEALYHAQENLLAELYQKAREQEVVVTISDGRERTIPVFQIVRMYAPNKMGGFAKVGFYISKFWEFVSDGAKGGKYGRRHIPRHFRNGDDGIHYEHRGSPPGSANGGLSQGICGR